MAYIGQTVNSFERRYNDNWSWWTCTGNCHLKSSALKHGHENFSIEILHDNIETRKELDELEVFYIKKYKTLHPNGYNFCISGNSHEYTENICDKISEGLRKGKTYKFKNPKGEIIEVGNLAKFCRENKLSNTMMTNVSSGKYKKHNGWTLPETILEEKKFKSPNGELFIIIEGELRPFCRKFNLHHGAMGQVWNKEICHFKGWVRFDSEPYKDYIRKLKSPEGIIYEIKHGDLKRFCKDLNLNEYGISKLITGKIKIYKNWIKYE